MRKLVALVLLALMAATGVGCVALSEYAAPAPRPTKAAEEYAVKAGVFDPNSYRGYANLAKARAFEKTLESAAKVYRLGLQQAHERHELDYGIHTKASAANTKKGEYAEQTLFGERGLISMGLTMAGLSGFTGLLGLMRKRPGDITPVELDTAVAQVGIDLKDKDRQMLEIVKGVSVFMDAYDEKTTPGAGLRSALEAKTNTDTKQVVAALKAV